MVGSLEASWNAIRARSLLVRRVSEYWVCGNEDEENSRKTTDLAILDNDIPPWRTRSPCTNVIANPRLRERRNDNPRIMLPKPADTLNTAIPRTEGEIRVEIQGGKESLCPWLSSDEFGPYILTFNFKIKNVFFFFFALYPIYHEGKIFPRN